MITTTDSFELKQSSIPNAGLGVFVTTDIKSNYFLALKPRGVAVGVVRHKKDIPVQFISHCIALENDTYVCPADFENMELVWYLNHSSKPNAEQRADGYYSLMPIAAGEEILIDYNTLNEPEDKKEAFYKR